MPLNLQTAQKRAQIIQNIRQFFINQNFLEVDTPILNPIPGMEPHLSPFKTTLTYPNSPKQQDLYLNTSPELQMKKLLGAGYPNIFNITKTFRNGEIGSKTHNPEFTMLEWYRNKANYQDLMQDCQDLLTHLAPNTYQPFQKISVQELFLQKCQINLLQNQTYKQLKQTAQQKGFDTTACHTWDDIFFKIFLNHLEKDLGKNRPTILFDYPITQAALAKKKNSQPFYAERFELYIDGIELANGFSELIDSKEQAKRLQEEQNLRQTLGKEPFPIDQQFLQALDQIRHPCAGIALGIDRLIMVLLQKTSIQEVIHFPLH